MIYVAVLGLYLLQVSTVSNPFFQPIGYLLGLFSVAVLIMALPEIRGIMRLLVFLMLIAGTVMLFAGGRDLITYLLGLQDMVYLLCLFMVIEIIGFPVSMTDLKPLFRPLVSLVKSPLLLFTLITVVAMFLGSIINIAVVPLVYYAVWESFSERVVDRPYQLGIALKRGLSFSLFWSPFGVAMALILEYSGASWLKMVPLNTALALVAILISTATDYIFYFRKTTILHTDVEKSSTVTGSETTSTLVTLLGYVLCLMVLVLFLNKYSTLGMVNILVISSVTFPLFWTLVRGQQVGFFMLVKTHFNLKVPAMSEQYSLFIAAGIFARGLQAVGFENVLNGMILSSSSLFGTAGTMVIIIILIMCTSWTGLHPAVTMVLIGQNLNFSAGPVPALYYAIAMAIGSALAQLTSPMTAATIIVSSLFKQNPFEVGIKWNILFVISFLTFLTAIFFIFL
jgi:C4-dicarboxylate transporter